MLILFSSPLSPPPTMPPKHFPLRWESTGDQWWFASPIDWAAANGHYDLVRELLHLDTNLLIKLTSLPRIRRLETVWDDDENFCDVANCRSQVARKLFQECETNKGHNSLIRAGYGGWLLYTAASAGDLAFVKELLERDPLLVFGEGEYGVTDILYAAARSKNSDVFKMLFDFSVSPKGEVSSVFKSEVVNRAVHAAARGGNVAALEDLLMDGGDVLGYRDVRGSTVLHAASGRGQVEVVKHLISSYDDIINSVDHRGNTALHVAAYRGHTAVLKLLICTSPSSASLINNYGDTLLHMAVSGFRSPGFRMVNRQIDLMKQLVNGDLLNIQEIINVQNNDGRTALHLAVIENIQTEIVQLIMTIRSVNLNARDAEGNTPLDLLKQRPRSESSEVLIKQLISAGGISDRTARNALVSHLRMHGIGPGSPGTSFKIPDGEILLHTSTEELTGSEYTFSGEIRSTDGSTSSKCKKSSSLNNRLKMLLGLQNKKDRNANKDSDSNLGEDDYSIDLYRTVSNSKNTPIPLRQQFAQASTLPNNKRILALPGNLFPSPSMKKKFAAGLRQGVLKVVTKPYVGSPSSAVSESSLNGVNRDGSRGPSTADQSPSGDNLKMKRKHGSFNLKLMNNYLCFGAQGLAVENSTRESKNHQYSVVV